MRGGGKVIAGIESFLDAHNGAITALATLVVAVFTAVLAVVTRRQARLTRDLAKAGAISAQAAQDSAATLPILERAYLFVETKPDSLGDLKLRLRILKDYRQESVKPEQKSEVNFHIVNHGKTPAIVKARTFTLQYRADTDPPAFVPPEPISAGAIVIRGGATYPEPDVIPAMPDNPRFDPGEVIAFKLAACLAQPLTSEEVERMGRGLFVLLFVGRVVYDDVFGNEHETRVCWRYDPETDSLIEHGARDWNRRT